MHFFALHFTLLESYNNETFASHMVMVTQTQFRHKKNSAMGYYRFLLPIWNVNKLYVIASHNKVNKKTIFGKLGFLTKIYWTNHWSKKQILIGVV